MSKKLFEKLDLFVFDMDGLLFDTETIYVNYGKKLAESKGYIINDSIVEKTTGMTNEATKAVYLEEFGKDFPYDELSSEIYKYIIEQGKKCKVPLMKGVEEFLAYLYSNGKKMVLATSADRLMADTLIENKGLKKYFSFIVTSNDVKKGKPDPEVFLTVAQKAGVSPEKAVVFEDSLNGIKAAHSAGMFAVMIPDKIQPTEEITKMLHCKLDSLLKAIEYFEKEV
ncbi:HAD family phosphatase [Leptotrichia sp. OH3620_COT-345]|uniref:HAD family hydrolase n=1 Tax=Leptotrichia sp. OH3620_COT-345 TaxID=2491048 RepID=UPI000F64BB4E|nr:HAD family phosphatase [Leptotrichia sp. OH3620_COT-345]RRD39136.1 HAD family phosphatase [Leptotrichia sp. OH3620_COT-345]